MSARTRLEELIAIKNRKKEFAARFNTTEQAVQRAFNDILEYGLSNSNIINTQDLVDSAQPEDALMHDLFDWTKTNDYRLAQAELYLLYIGILLAADGDVYDIVLQA